MNQESTGVNYSLALKNFNQNGRGRSMRKFCEDEGYDSAMVTMSSEYSIYLYREKVDLRKGISGLSGIVKSAMGMNPTTSKSSSATKVMTMSPVVERPEMKWVLECGDVELSNNLSEQMMRSIKMNLKNVGNIGSEESAKHNAFMFSVIESCKMNKRTVEDYLMSLLDKLKLSREGET